ncbi:MAG: hypothetical protein WCE48_11570 [Steroidobacteraceae bacterium]
MRSSAVADILRVNGRVLDIRQFDSVQPVDAIERRARAIWNDGRKNTVAVTESEDWLLIAAVRGDRFATLRLQASPEGTHGFLVESDLDGGPAIDPHKPMRFPVGSKIASIVESTDAGRAATQWMVVLPMLADPLREMSRNALSAGWRPTGLHGSMASFRRGDNEMILAVKRTNGEALVIVNVVRSG